MTSGGKAPSTKSAFGLPQADLMIRGRIVTCAESDGDPLGIIEDGALCVSGDRISYVGPAIHTPAAEVIEVSGCVMPGLIDAHTHLCFSGDRIAEAAARFAGVDYRTVSKEGGGIMSTVRATRAASDAELRASAAARAAALRSGGVTTIEAKSGYGLTTHDELRLIAAAKSVEEAGIARVEATFLGAHAVPPDRTQSDYVIEVVHEQLPAVAEQGLASACDVYCDDGAFTLEEAKEVLSAAKTLGLKVKAHLGQFKDLGGPQMAARLDALSADHLEDVSDEGLAAMAASGMVGVLLPVAWRTLRQVAPDAGRFRARGIPLAVATDLNPGTSPTADLLLCAALAVRDAGLTMEEALLGVTRHAAHALGVRDRGVLRVGALADIAIFADADPRALVYSVGSVKAAHVFIGGKRVVTNPSAAAIW